MKELDSNMLISDQISAELLIESAGLTKQEQLMIRTAAKNHTFDDYAAILLEHHGRIHLKDSRSLGTAVQVHFQLPPEEGTIQRVVQRTTKVLVWKQSHSPLVRSQ